MFSSDSKWKPPEFQWYDTCLKVFTVKILTIRTPKKFAVITLKFEQDALPKSKAPKRWSRNCKQCRPWSDCSSRSSLTWVCTVFPGLSVQKLRIITVSLIPTQYLLHHNNCKNSNTRKNCFNYPKIGTVSLYHRVVGSKDADEMANSVDPDQTAPWGKFSSDKGKICLVFFINLIFENFFPYKEKRDQVKAQGKC